MGKAVLGERLWVSRLLLVSKQVLVLVVLLVREEEGGLPLHDCRPPDLTPLLGPPPSAHRLALGLALALTDAPPRLGLVRAGDLFMGWAPALQGLSRGRVCTCCVQQV
jgi:hypothetical protein